jgi:hypothetical protein
VDQVGWWHEHAPAHLQADLTRGLLIAATATKLLACETCRGLVSKNRSRLRATGCYREFDFAWAMVWRARFPVKMGLVMAPAIMMSAASAPAVVMAAPAAAHVATAVSMTAPDLDHRIVLRGHRGHAQSGRGGRGQCKR